MDIDQQLLLNAVIKQESGGNPNAVSPKGASGIMQIMPDTARDPGYGVKPLQGWDGVDPRTAPVEEQIRFGNDYLNAMRGEYGGDINLALAAYNAGPGAVDKYGGIPPYQETQNYVKNISSNLPQQNTQLDIQWDVQEQAGSSGLDIQWGVPEVDGSFIGDIKKGFENRTSQMQQAADAYVAGEQPYLDTAAQQGLAFASNVPDMLMTTASHVTPEFIKDAGKKVFDAGMFLGANTIGELPVGFGGKGKVRDVLPQEMAGISEGNTRTDRNVRAIGQTLNLLPTTKGLGVAAEGGKSAVKTVMGNGVVKSYLKDEGTTAANKVAASVEKASLKTADEMGKLARESYDEAAYLGAKFEPKQVADKIDQKLSQLKPKALPNGKFTTEDTELLRHIDELTGLTGKQLSLGDIQRLDESLTQKINKFVDPKTGDLDTNGRKLYLLQKDVRQIVYDADVAGNNALVNGRNFYRAQMMMNDLDSAAERASMNATNPGSALQREYKKLYLDKDRTKNWPQEVRAELKKAAQPNGLDEALDFFGSRLPAAIGLGSGNIPAAASAHLIGMASRGAKEGVIAKRGARVQQAVVNDVLKKVKPVKIGDPTIAEKLLLPPPSKMSALGMTDSQVRKAQKQLNLEPTKRIDTSGAATKTPVSRMTSLREALGKAKGKKFETALKYYEQGNQSQNQFVKDMIKDFGLTQTQARQLAKEIKQYGTKKEK